MAKREYFIDCFLLRMSCHNKAHLLICMNCCRHHRFEFIEVKCCFLLNYNFYAILCHDICKLHSVQIK